MSQLWFRMAVINDLLEQQQQQESESIPNNFLSQVIELIREINQLLNNPVVLQRFNNQISQQQPIQTTLPQIQQQEFNEEKFIQFIQTPQGREMLIRGLERVKEMVGDLRISEIITMLRGGKNVKPNK